MPTGLQKTVIDVPFTGGLSEKIHPDVATPDGMYLLENVEIDKVGVYRRRPGFDIMSSAIVNSASQRGVPKKIAGREEELVVITEDLGHLGSGGGSGASGSTLWTWSPEANAWRDNGKLSSLTIERFAGISNGQPHIKAIDCCYCSAFGEEFVVLAFTEAEFAGSNQGVYIVAYDVTSRSMVMEPRNVGTAGSFYTGKVQTVAVGQYAVILSRSSALGAADFVASIYDAESNGLTTNVSIFSASSNGSFDKWCATSDGTNLYISYYDGTTSVFVEKFSVTALAVNSVAATSVAAAVDGGLWVSNGGGILSTTWLDLATGVKYWAVTASSMTQVAAPITHSTVADASTRTYSTHLSSTDVVVFWDLGNGGGTHDFSVVWQWVKNAATAPASRANIHAQPTVQVVGAPFVYNSRVFCPLVGTSDGNPEWENEIAAPLMGSGVSNFGHCICEVNANPTAEDDTANGNPFITFLPVAIWGRDISRYTLPGLGGFGGASDRYIATVRQARVSDVFFKERQDETPVAHSTALWSIDIMRIEFDDPKRWHHAEGNSLLVVAGALPFVYDGMNTHECGFLFRPAIMAIAETGVGVYSAGDTLLYKVVYEWEDVRGSRWFSDTSIRARHTVVGTNVAVQMRIRVPAITAKPLGGSGFTGRIKMNLYRADPEAPDDFRLLLSDTFMIFDAAGDPHINFHVVTDTGTSDLEANERAYIFGNELDNVCGPPCRSIVQHRDRFFAIDTEDNYLWYTKPFTRGRGLEWAREQRLPLPSKGKALASVEGSLLVYTERQVLVLEGQGPSVTGQPPDSYSRLMILSQDQGCSEVNAAWRFPGGSAFRTFQGLWSVGSTLGLAYLGAPVEDLVSDVERFIDASIDEINGCLAMLVTDGESFSVIRFWYDTGRWSRDTYSATAFGTVYSSFFHRGDYYLATTEGVVKRSPHIFRDGSESLSEVYLMRVRTGRHRLDSLASFKRMWRSLATVRSDDDAEALLLGAPSGPGLDLALTVETHGTVDGSTTAVFRGVNLGGGVPKTVRSHLKYQKGQSYQITLEERRSMETLLAIRGPFGYTFLGLGFEIGIKRGASKLSGSRSA